MGVLDRIRHFRDPSRGLGVGHRGQRHPISQTAPLDVFGNHEAESVGAPADVKDRNDSLVVKAGDEPGLFEISLDILGSFDPFGAGNLDRYESIQLVVLAEQDESEPTPAEEALDKVPPHHLGQRPIVGFCA
jgi:hypothetical protein